MSYILDALRRAESERERGQVPGLHAQPVPVGLGEGGSVRQGRGLRLAAVAAGVLVVLGGAGWWLARPAPEAAGPAAGRAMDGGVTAASASAPAVAAATAPATAGDTAPTAPAPAGPPLLVAPPTPPAPPPPPPPARPRPPAPAPEPAPARTATTVAAASPAPAMPPAAAAPALPAVPAPVPAGAATPASPSTPPSPATPPAARPEDVGARPAPAGTAVPASPPGAPGVAGGPPAAVPGAPGSVTARPTLLADLPPAQRAELPQMRVGGSIYSDQPSSRFVVINGLVVREGETAAPGVVLERIAPKAAVIRWREMRIEMPL